MNYRNPIIISSFAAVLLFAAPVLSFAKDNGKGKDKGEENNSKTEQTIKTRESDSSCMKAFGHLIAPGWIKHNGPVNVGLECHLPFGIGKKFSGNNASSTPDVTAPVLGTVTFKPAQTQTEVRWTTNERSDSTVFWSTTTTVDTSSGASNAVNRSALGTDHRSVIRHLTPNTTYYVVVRSRDAAGNSTLSGTMSFTTVAPAADTNAPVISSIATLVSSSTIQVGWKTNENSTGRVFYSTTLPVNLGTAAFVDASSTLDTNHVLTISGLSSNTHYFLVVESTDVAGNTSTSATFAATTLVGATTTPVDTTAPVVSNITVTPGSSMTTVAWTTDEPSTSKVFYSSVTPLDMNASTTQFVLNASLVTSHSLTVSGLATSTPYHFIIQSSDAVNNVATSSEFTATTTTM